MTEEKLKQANEMAVWLNKLKEEKRLVQKGDEIEFTVRIYAWLGFRQRNVTYGKDHNNRIREIVIGAIVQELDFQIDYFQKRLEEL
jgi:hypothetical protein